MKRFAIAAAITAGLLWNAGAASAQYRPHGTMSGRNLTMSGHLQTNHNHLTPRPVGVTSYSPQYYGGGVILPAGGFPIGTSVSPGGNSYNPSVWSGPVYPAGGYGLYGRRW